MWRAEHQCGQGDSGEHGQDSEFSHDSHPEFAPVGPRSPSRIVLVAGACQEFGVPNLRSLSSGLDWVMKRCLQLVRGILGRPLIGGVEPVAASCGRIVSTVAVPIVQRDTATLSRRMPVTGRCPHRCGLRDGETDRPSSQADRLAKTMSAAAADTSGRWAIGTYSHSSMSGRPSAGRPTPVRAWLQSLAGCAGSPRRCCPRSRDFPAHWCRARGGVG